MFDRFWSVNPWLQQFFKSDEDIINEYDVIYNPDIIDEYIEN